MKKVTKWIIGVFAVLLALAAVLALLAFTHPRWLGGVAAGVANRTVPGLLETEFSLGGLKLNAFTGEAELKDLYVANPSNFVERDALKLSSLKISVEPETVMSDVIHIRLIEVDGAFINYIKQNGVTNFDIITSKFSSDEEVQAEAFQEENSADKKSRRIIIDRICVSNLKIKYGPIVFPLPIPITLTDIGKDDGGVDSSVAVMEILEQLLTAALNAGNSAKDMVSQIILSSLSVSTNAVNDAKNLKDTFKSVGDSFKDSFKILKQELKK